MGLSTAERNRRKRERKKLERKKQEEEKKKEAEAKAAAAAEKKKDDDVEIDYVAEQPALPDEAADTEGFEAVKRRFLQDPQQPQRASSVVVSDEDDKDDEDEELQHTSSKRKLKESLRPSMADLKRRVARPDLVEAHDVTAPDADFLIYLKGVPGTVPVPRHWGRKRKYLQGKRGFEKPPFQLPDFILATGIAEVRDAIAGDEAGMTAKQKNRQRVAPKLGAMDVDYKTLYDAFFKHQTKPTNLTKFGDLYYEGKELETNTQKYHPGRPLSQNLKNALGMVEATAPPPWLLNMQRYGPPPSFPTLKIPGLTAPLPSPDCQYGFHPGGWGKPPVDPYHRPLYGGNPFDPPGSGNDDRYDASSGALVTSDGKTIGKAEWGALPTGLEEDEESEHEQAESSEDEMEESDEEEEEGEAKEDEDGPTVVKTGVESVLPPPSSGVPVELRKQAGDETPAPSTAAKQLYQVVDQRKQPAAEQQKAVFASEVQYVVPKAAPDGAESVLSKAVAPAATAASNKKKNDEDENDLGKNFKF